MLEQNKDFTKLKRTDDKRLLSGEKNKRMHDAIEAVKEKLKQIDCAPLCEGEGGCARCDAVTILKGLEKS